MATLLILYGRPTDPDAFERYYFDEHLPFAGETMPNVRGATSGRVVGTASGDDSDVYRYAAMTYDSVDSLREGISSEDGRRVLADLDNFATGGVQVLIVEDDG
jgi:uncharacterized protein (TIGR02118 family)